MEMEKMAEGWSRGRTASMEHRGRVGSRAILSMMGTCHCARAQTHRTCNIKTERFGWL